MRSIARVVGSVVMAIAVCGRAGVADAQLCADSDGNGEVTVSDGVNLLRAAAGLSSNCVLQVCDVNLDGTISVTDGVIALRQAAGLPTNISCSRQQVSDAVATTQEILGIGVAVVPGTSAAHAARATTLCQDGGSFDEQPDHVDFFACDEAGFTLSGTFFFSQDSTGAVMLSTSGFSITDDQTGESLIFSANISIQSAPSTFASGTFANGALSFSSDSLGVFTLSLSNVAIAADGTIFGGGILLEVQNGSGAFAKVGSLQIQFVGPVILADVLFRNETRVTVFIDDSVGSQGVCAPCIGSNDCNSGLGCFPCTPEPEKACTGTTDRCSVTANFALECEDGFF